MRVGIRVQLGLVVLVASLVPLIVLALATWYNNYNFTVNVKENALSLTASLKAASVASDLLLIRATCSTIVTRILIQQAIRNLYKGEPDWADAKEDVQSALASGGLSALLQVKIFSRNETGSVNGILNVTANASGIEMPYDNLNNQPTFLGDADQGYPPSLYPNISYVQTTTPDPSAPGTNFTEVSAFADYPLNQSAALLLGPLQINSTYALVSLTLPIIDNSNSDNVLGYMTVVAAATSLIDVIYSREGLGNTGIVLVVGTNRRDNQFPYAMRPATATYQPDLHNLTKATVKYVFPPYPLAGQTDRHSIYNANLSRYGTSNFSEGQYPGILHGFGEQNPMINNASSYITTTNEQGVDVAVGWARPQSDLVDWLLIVEQHHSEAWEPIIKLRDILLACVFGTFGLIIIVAVPMAHFSVRPIRRLRDATKKSIQPPGYTPRPSIDDEPYGDEGVGDEEIGEGNSNGSKKMGFLVRLKRLTHSGRRMSRAEKSGADRRRDFKIPGKVPDRKHWIHDELTDLTSKFNEMSDELLSQYTSLESKVAERTEQLEHSKKAAEAANESKTLFIANISHELKTPLNGIIGMCAVCMGEDDLPSIKRSLKTIYKSGDLLLNLLNDLLTFSKNQIGQQLNLEEKEFRLSDVKEQIKNIFRKQVDEGGINFGVHFLSTESMDLTEQPTGEQLPALGPNGIGRLKDMCLWGDQHRILQIIINLVSNSLKFTPPGGQVEVRIRCIGELESSSDGANSRISMGSKQSSQKRNARTRNGSSSNASGHTATYASGQISRTGSGTKAPGTALMINPMDPRARLQLNERSATPPPNNARTLWFSIEVEDTGPGIPQHLQERVFEPFVQADLGLNKKYGGTGLGLSICSQLAGLMGGSISLVSTLGEGSTFSVQLPLKFVKERAPSTSSSDVIGSRPASVVSQPDDRHTPKGSIDTTTAVGSPGKSSKSYSIDTQPRLVGLRQPFFASSPPPPPNEDSAKTQLAAVDRAAKEKVGGKKIRVLVAEDNLVNQEVVLRMLKLEDVYDVVIAKDGQEAYDMVKQSMEEGKFFNLIFMDIQMPNLDGLQSTRLIREMGYSAPIVALTAFAEESNVKECYESGMNHFLSKPIRRPALKQVLKKFATIPEETEDSPLTRKNTPEKGQASKQKLTEPTSTSTSTPSSDSDTNLVKTNGTPSPPSPPTTT
ncbi:histidine kinase-group VI protein [Sclerotinia borealis F-4128]|uniref:histidine kinase n=1 Tax=Sclerotinia borealis (strain F-4128) TaxID=1432307 RepID=W9C2T2_SCLBF|nr:histidine kinase-group VI protein [Sclerotinia borealis F-4128]